MAEGKKLAIHKHGREVELSTVEKRPRVLPIMAYTERQRLTCKQALLFGRASCEAARGRRLLFTIYPKWRACSQARPRPKGVPFSRLQVYERLGILLVEVNERVGNLSFGSMKGSKGPTDVFYDFIYSRGNVLFL